MALPHALSTSSSFSEGDVEAVHLNLAIILNKTGEGARQPSGFLCFILSRFLSKQMSPLPVPSGTLSTYPPHLPERQPGKQSSSQFPLSTLDSRKSFVFHAGPWELGCLGIFLPCFLVCPWSSLYLVMAIHFLSPS